ncbi:MAG: DUF3164 family protein [Treponemataceae bacterium]
MNEKEFMKNSKGGYDPIATIKPIDLARNDLVNDIVKKSKAMSKEIAKMKRGFFEDINAFLELSSEKYGVKLGGKKGNVTLVSYDGQYKVILAVNETIQFDERLLVAKELIDQCIEEWAEGARAELRALVNDAFYVGKSGKLNTNRILGLRRLDISDEKWKKAMEAISESVMTVDSKEYIRIYQRNEEGEYDLINLDIASL